jgi:PAS domain S-box-containing protein
MHRGSWPVAAVFVLIVAIQVLVAAISIDVLSAVRAYVTGESLYSKGQKDAQMHLLAYAQHFRPQDYHRFHEAIAVPLGDRRAREALQASPPDLEAARRGFLDGGNHPDDIDGLIRLFRWLGDVSFMAGAIQTWEQGDRVIEQMRVLVESAHAHASAGDVQAPAVREMREQAPLLNARMTELERRFSAELGEASRRTQGLLLAVNLLLAGLLAFTGMRFVRRTSHLQAVAEDEVRRRQESLQRLLDSTAEGLFGVDVRGRCTFINRAALRLLGYDREADLLGREIHALVHHSHPDGRAYGPGESRLDSAQRDWPRHVADEVFWRRDGSAFPVEYWAHPVQHDGKVQGAVVTFFDITERMRLQATLREGEARMARLVDAVTDGVITIDTSERIVLFNRAAQRLFGVPADAALGSPIGRFVPNGFGKPDHPDPGEEGRAPAAVHELTGTRADGSEFPMEVSVSRFDTGAGLLTTVVLRDVTELRAARAERQAREALEAASRAKTEFLSRMSHELRTPLNAVLGFSQLLRLDKDHPASRPQLERIRHIENSGAHLLALVNDVLDLSRVEAGQLALLVEPVSLQQVAEEAVAMISPLAAECGVEISAPRPDGGGEPGGQVQADHVRLRQVLVNLLSNAVKYNRRGGRVSLGWHGTAQGCIVTVADTGPGIPPEKLVHLFEPFNRLGAEASKVDGTGIGLVLSRRLVELMQGRLKVDSVVGEGTIATLELRVCEYHAAPAPLPAAPSQHGALDDRLNVLYAEDNEVNVELVRQVAAFRPAIHLRVAENGASALAMASEFPPDLMLVDMNLGDMSGIELAEALRRSPLTAGIRLVALSADALPEQIHAALTRGFEHYLTKPIDFRRLLTVLDMRPST